MVPTSAVTVYTIGHSTHPIDSFIEMLKAYGVTMVGDLRTVPRSRHNPQFNRETLSDGLAASGIGYEHLAQLGGLRKPLKESPNAGWRNASFRGFADYMASPEFEAGLARVLESSARQTIAVMCAEAVPWRCRRSLVAAALVVRGE